MGDFKGGSWHIYLNKDTKERRDEILDHLQSNYDGPSDFVAEKLQQETALNIDERIERAKSEKEQYEEKINRLKQIKKDRNKASLLRDKKELLQEKQKKLRNLPDDGSYTREQIRNEVENKLLDKKLSSYSDEEYLEKKSDKIKRIVDSRMDDAPNVDQLVNDVQRLQNEIKELNNGEALDCFMSIQGSPNSSSQEAI